MRSNSSTLIQRGHWNDDDGREQVLSGSNAAGSTVRGRLLCLSFLTPFFWHSSGTHGKAAVNKNAEAASASALSLKLQPLRFPDLVEGSETGLLVTAIGDDTAENRPRRSTVA